MDRKGIVMAHGGGDHLYPATTGSSKFMLPVYNKPMIYYPLSLLMLAGIRDILVVSGEADAAHYRLALGDGSDFGIRLSFTCVPDGTESVLASLTAQRLITETPMTLIDGDMLLYGHGLCQLLRAACADGAGATTFVNRIGDAHHLDTMTLDHRDRLLSIQKAELCPNSQYAATGMHFFDGAVPYTVRTIIDKGAGAPATRHVLRAYLDQGKLAVVRVGRGLACLHTRTHADLLAAAQFVETVQKRQGTMIACLEEIGWRNGWLEHGLMYAAGSRLAKSRYGRYLLVLAEATKNDGHRHRIGRETRTGWE